MIEKTLKPQTCRSLRRAPKPCTKEPGQVLTQLLLWGPWAPRIEPPSSLVSATTRPLDEIHGSGVQGLRFRFGWGFLSFAVKLFCFSFREFRSLGFRVLPSFWDAVGRVLLVLGSTP